MLWSRYFFDDSDFVIVTGGGTGIFFANGTTTSPIVATAIFQDIDQNQMTVAKAVSTSPILVHKIFQKPNQAIAVNSSTIQVSAASNQ